MSHRAAAKLAKKQEQLAEKEAVEAKELELSHEEQVVEVTTALIVEKEVQQLQE
eukprot:SAG22_NODE_15810_length_340_cov_0.643154_2_plen_53_part_01